MSFSIHYYCYSDIGKCRSINQDNFICAGQYLTDDHETVYPISGVINSSQPSLVGVFDGMGGEEHGEVAAKIAAECASEIKLKKPARDLLEFCTSANEKICKYSEGNDIYSMGTTAAMIAYSKNYLTLCNIGDSRIYRYRNGQLTQLSVDHYGVAAFGMKPPLSQNLGIPSSEMIIDPYVINQKYRNGDIYLLCTDGLTDMVSEDEISKTFKETEISLAGRQLLNSALNHGGKDNITIILCRIEKNSGWLFNFFK